MTKSEVGVALWQCRHQVAIAAILSMVTHVLLLWPTVYMLQIYDRVLVSQSELTLLALSLVTLFLLGIVTLAEWLRSRTLVAMSVRLDALLGERVFNASFEARLNPAQPTTERPADDLTELRQFVTGGGIFAFFDALWTPVYLLVLFFLQPWLGLLAVIFTALQASIACWGHWRNRLIYQAADQARNDVHARLRSQLQHAEVVEAMGMLRGLRQRWDAHHAVHLARIARAQGLAHRLAASSKFVRYTQQSLALGAGALLVIDGQLTAGAMIAANVLMSRTLAPIDMLVGTWRSFLGARAAFRRLGMLLDTYPERPTRQQPQDAPTGTVALRGVTVSLPGIATPLLQDIGLSASPGMVTVVLGPSGSGKSTLARVIMGIWPTTAGEVLLDGRPLRSWDRVQLGPHLGYLPQDIELFDGTIAENIARSGEVDPVKVIAAAQATGVHETILRFSRGYDTPIGEAGHLLSGGQRQRIGLARALYGNPCLVVLDEPNANLDQEGEAALLMAVRKLKAAGKTVFLISHRPNAFAAADRLLILQGGRIHAYGPRDAVLGSVPSASSVPLTPDTRYS